MEAQRHNTFLTSALEYSASHPGRFYPRRKNRRYALVRRLGEPQRWSQNCGLVGILLPLPGMEPMVVEAAAGSRYGLG
jgi:hypothetical protein